MLQFGTELRAAALEEQRLLKRKPVPRSVNRAETWIVEGHYSRGEGDGHTVESDEPEERGGTGRGPWPLQYLLMSLGFCQQSMLAKNAALSELSLESVRVHVKGYFDRRGGHVHGIPNQGIEEIRSDVFIDSPESEDTIRNLMNTVERQCYVLNTLKRAVAIRQTIRLNGIVVARTEHVPGSD